MPIVLDGTQGISTPMYAGSISSNPVTPSVNMKNRIINGNCVIDQRNAGASVTPSGDPVYTLDRWYITQSQNSKFSIQQNAGSVTPPVGFSRYLGATVVSAVSVGASDFFALAQGIEGFNIADLNWGSANAKTVTLSFQVYSSLTGTFGGALRNTTGNLSYPFTYTISSANTWTAVSVTIAGPTSGTWNTNNSEGVTIRFGLGAGSTWSGTAGAWATGNYFSATGATSVVGTSGATFYITGVQLEVGSTATSFDYRPYGTELALCQRYYYKTYNTNVAVGTSTVEGLMPLEVLADGTLTRLKPFSARLPVSMRAQPTVTTYSETGTADRISVYNNSVTTLTVSSIAGRGENSFGSYLNTTTNASTTASYVCQFVASAEL
jgi:hypothetical protein